MLCGEIRQHLIKLIGLVVIVVVISSVCNKNENINTSTTASDDFEGRNNNQEQSDPVDAEDNTDEVDVESSNDKTADQLELGIGDIGKFDTTLGTYGITLDSGMVFEDEVDGELPDLEVLCY